MRIGRKWGIGLLGIAVAGTVALVLPTQAPSDHGTSYALAAIQPDRAVQQEAIAIANRVDSALRRSTSLLSTVAEGDLAAFSRERIALNAVNSQWPITLFTASAGKGSEFTLQPPGERFLSAEDVSDIQRRGPWVAERPQVRALIAAVPSRTGQVLAAKIPFSYFADAIASLPKAEGVRHYLLDARGKALENASSPMGEDRDWCEQLIREGEGFLATSDALFAVARVPSTGWAVVVRHPLSGVNPPLALDPAFMNGPAMVATAPLGAGGIPKGLIIYPLAGVVLLFGLALVGWKQRWPGMEEGPIAMFGEHGLRRVTGPLRDRLKGRATPPPSSGHEGLVPFTAEAPTQLPAAIAGDDVEFLRSEQVRNLRELWSHTEERLSGQRSWVREEVRKLQETATTSFSELSTIVNQTEQRLEDARSAWGDVQASLLSRIDEARNGLADAQDARRSLVERIEQQDRRLGDSLEAFETRVGDDLSASDARLAEQLGAIDQRLTGEMASLGVKLKMEIAGLTSRTDERHAALDERLAREVEAIKAKLASDLSASQERGEATREDLTKQLGALDERIATETAALHKRLTQELANQQDRSAQDISALDHRVGDRIGELEARLAQDLALTDARMKEDFARLEAAIGSARAALDSLEARESADSDDARLAIDAQSERLSTLQDALVEAEERLGSELRTHATDVREVEQRIQSTAERFADEIAAVSVHAERLEEALHDFEGRVATYRDALDERIVTLQADLQDGIADGEARSREALAEQQIALERLRGDLDITVEQALPRLRTEIEEVRGDVAERVEGFIQDLEARLAALDKQLKEAAEQRLAEGLDRMESTLQELRDELNSAQEGHQADLETLMAELAVIADEALPSLRREVAPVRAFDERVRGIETRASNAESRLDGFAEQVKAIRTEAEALAARQKAGDERHAELDSRLGALDDTLAPLPERLDALEGDVAPLPGRVEALEGQISPLSNRIDALEGSVSPMSGRVEALEAGLGQLDERWTSAEERFDTLIKETDAGLRGIADDLRRDQGALDKRVQETEGRFLGKVEDLASRTGAIESLANQRFEQAQAAIGGLDAKLAVSQQAQEESRRLSGELGGIKGRLEGLALAHGRQQETLNAALSQLAKLQQEMSGQRQDPQLAGRVDDLTGFVQQLAEQSQLLAQALDANTAAAARTEGWLQEELGNLQSTQGQALAALEKENADLKASLETMRETQEALSHRMHMVVQVLSKLSK